MKEIVRQVARQVAVAGGNHFGAVVFAVVSHSSWPGGELSSVSCHPGLLLQQPHHKKSTWHNVFDTRCINDVIHFEIDSCGLVHVQCLS